MIAAARSNTTQFTEGLDRGATLRLAKSDVRKTFVTKLFEGDVKQKLIELFSLAVECLKITLSCLLAIFVPQKCPAILDSSNPELQVPHTCTPRENFEDLTPFNTFVVIWNFGCIGFMLFHYHSVWRRERFLIEYLDENPALPFTYLSNLLSKYPPLDEKFVHHNRIVLFTSVFGIMMLLVNLVTSGVLVFRDYYDGFRSVTVYITNVSLLGNVMYIAFSNSYKGLIHQRAFSCINFTPYAFNTLDPRYAKAIGHRDSIVGMEHQDSKK
jgi:hypothetical protein